MTVTVPKGYVAEALLGSDGALFKSPTPGSLRLVQTGTGFPGTPMTVYADAAGSSPDPTGAAHTDAMGNLRAYLDPDVGHFDTFTAAGQLFASDLEVPVPLTRPTRPETVNGKSADASGNITLAPSDVGASPAPAHGPYLAFTFGGNTGAQQALSVLGSTDGKSFRSSGDNPVLVPPTGFVRDPSVIQMGATFYVAFTTASYASYTGTSFDIWKSTDPATRGSWTKVTTVDCSVATTAAGTGPQGVAGPETWAPDLLVDTDGTVYAFFSANEYTTYWTKAIDAALTTWTTPAKLTITGGAASSIDVDIIKVATTYHLFYKNQLQTFGGCYVEHGTSTAATGPYAVDRTGNWLGWPAVTSQGLGYEGPDVVQVGPSLWRMYVDISDLNIGMAWAETTDPSLITGWSQPVSCTVDGATQPTINLMRHGAVLPLRSVDAAAAASQSSGMQAASTLTRSYGETCHTSGPMTIGQVFVSLDTATDIVLGPCKPGDVIQAGASLVWQPSSTAEGGLDVATVTGGAGGTVQNRFGPSHGIVAAGIAQPSAWTPGNSGITPAGFTDWYVVQPADIDTDGTVRLSLQGRTNGSGQTRSIYGDTTNGVRFWARKHS